MPDTAVPELQTLRTAVAGVGGYAGGELARLLLAHPRMQGTPPLFLGRVADESPTGTVPLEQLHPQLARGGGRTLPPVEAFSWKLIEDRRIDLVFLALPHENSREWAPEWLARGIKVIDLSGAWRLADPAHRAVYKLTDKDPELAARLQAEAVFGCPELYRDEIAAGLWRRARLVANPGCYSTSILLALAPFLRAGLLDLDHGIIADSKSGVSGAGKSPTATTHFMHAADNLSAYALHRHRHTGELLEQLHLTDAQIQFTPHLLPIPRGILSTTYARLAISIPNAKAEFTELVQNITLSPKQRKSDIIKIPGDDVGESAKAFSEKGLTPFSRSDDDTPKKGETLTAKALASGTLFAVPMPEASEKSPQGVATAPTWSDLPSGEAVETKLQECIMNFYASSPMVRVSPAGTLPEIQQSVRTNYCDIGISLAPDGKRLIIVSCLDNLLKGASGQAVQNMNLMSGWKEEEGLV